MRILVFFSCFFLCMAAQAQLGVKQLAVSDVGNSVVARTDIGRGSLPMCPYPRKCQPADCAVFTFIGSGSWEEPSNWEFGLVPPTIIAGCFEIRVRPVGNTKAIMIVPESIMLGGKLIVEPGKQLIVPGKLIIQQ